MALLLAMLVAEDDDDENAGVSHLSLLRYMQRGA